MTLALQPKRYFLRTDQFRTKLREATKSISVAFTNTAADPRIGAKVMDVIGATKTALGVEFHYVIRTDGRVELGRHPLTVSSRLHRNTLATHLAIHIGIVGGLDEDTGQRLQSTTVAQEQALEELMQLLADTLRVPLEVHDSRPAWCRSEERQAALDEQEAELEEAMDRADALFRRSTNNSEVELRV